MRNKLVSVVGVNPPADIASGRAHIVRWTMVLRRPKQSVDLHRCAVEVCHAIAGRAPRSKNAEAFLKDGVTKKLYG